MTLTTEQLDKLTREELLERLKQRVEELEAENERLKNRSANSRNSSQPPSRDQKVNRPPKKKRKKRGTPFGHQKFSRPLVDNPDRVIQLPATECEHCLADLSGVRPEDFERRQITELPTAKPIVIETRRHHTTCPHCLTLNRAILPEGLEAERCFGPNLEATVIFYKQTQHLSIERSVETMRDLHGVDLSEGAVASIIEVMGQLAVKVWVCDCYGAQLKAPAEVFQLCLAHQLRDLQRVLDSSPAELWAQAAQKLFRDAIHLRNRFASSEMTLSGFLRRVTQTENQLDRLLEEELKNEAARKLQNRFSTHRDKLLTFLHYPNVPPTNNESEQALRGSVIHRKVTNGFRSEWGAKAYAALQTIIATAKQKGEQIFQTLVNLMGPPVLPFLAASSP